MLASSTLCQSVRRCSREIGRTSGAPVVVIQKQPADAAAREHLGGDAAYASNALRRDACERCAGQGVLKTRHNGDRFVAYTLIVCNHAHALQRHQTAVRVGIHNLRVQGQARKDKAGSQKRSCVCCDLQHVPRRSFFRCAGAQRRLTQPWW